MVTGGFEPTPISYVAIVPESKILVTASGSVTNTT
jgi:hypothetical protein